MPRSYYFKPPLTFRQQFELLKRRGLSIKNEKRFLHLLEQIGYYRLSGYWYPMLEDKENHIFKHGASFEKAYNLYLFDKELRKLIQCELEKIEVSIRSQMCNVLSISYGPFWFEDTSLFKSRNKLNKTLKQIKEEVSRSDEMFIQNFKSKYFETYPPSWMTMEVITFGKLSILYSNLDSIPEKRKIANFYGLDETTFESWLHSFVYLRNLCAHHSRLWNKVLSIQPRKPHNPKRQWLNDSTAANNKVFYILSMLVFLLNTINPNTSFVRKVRKLFRQYSNIDPSAMGFIDGWESEPLWAKKSLCNR